MTWEHVVAIVVPVLCAAITPMIPVLLAWLKKQKIVRQAQLENFLESMIPAVVNAVEAWAANLEKNEQKPSSEAKLSKAKEIVKKRAPMLKDANDIVDRIEAELFKKNGG